MPDLNGLLAQSRLADLFDHAEADSALDALNTALEKIEEARKILAADRYMDARMALDEAIDVIRPDIDRLGDMLAEFEQAGGLLLAA